jgi:hypothetical protein
MNADDPTGPALAGRSAADEAFYEWLLSDHPAAAAERARRRADHHARETRELQMLRAWVARTRADPDAGMPYQRLAEAGERLLDRRAARLAADQAEPAPARLVRLRRELETTRRATGDPDYRYPARYLGPRAARQPIPPDPGRTTDRAEADCER